MSTNRPRANDDPRGPSSSPGPTVGAGIGSASAVPTPPGRLGETIIPAPECESALDADARNASWFRSGFTDDPRRTPEATARRPRAYVRVVELDGSSRSRGCPSPQASEDDA